MMGKGLNVVDQKKNYLPPMYWLTFMKSHIDMSAGDRLPARYTNSLSSPLAT
jgi:hypothetical protein